MRNICTIEDCEDNQKGFGYCNRHYKKFKRYGDPNYSAHSRTPRERLWARVEKSPGCWLWTGCLNSEGYGIFNVGSGRRVLTHRFAYEDSVGPIPEGMFIDHMCHTRACCNPLHLRVVTQKQNIENQAGLRVTNTSGMVGVRVNRKTGKYSASVRHYGRLYAEYGFSTLEEAGEAARQIRIRLHTHNDFDRRTA